MRRRHPAAHYVVVDYKPVLLGAMKLAMGERLTTVFVRQGHYALTAQATRAEPPPDMTIECIGDLLNLDFTKLRVNS